MKRWYIYLIMCVVLNFLQARDTLIYIGKFEPSDVVLRDGWVVGDIGYLTWEHYPDSFGIFIIDLTDRTNPVKISHLRIPSFPYSIEVHDSLAYVAADDGLYIINVKNPENPQLIGSLLAGLMRDLEIVDTICYVCNFIPPPSLYVINIKDPSSPSLITTYTPSFVPCYWYLKYYNNILFATQYEVLNSIDVSNPQNPVFLDTLWVPMPSPPGFRDIQSIDIFPPYVYCGTDAGMWIVDASNPSHLISLVLMDSIRGEGAIFIRDSLLFRAVGPSVWKIIPDPIHPVEIANCHWLFYGQRLFVDPLYYVYHISLYTAPYPWEIYQLQQVGIKEGKNQEEYFDVKIDKRKVRIFYNLLVPQYGEIYVIDKTGRILDFLKKGIIKNGEIFYEIKSPGIYFVVLEKRDKTLKKMINIIK
ncbi:MAG: hypothetical protein ABIM36_01150 [candidate division WOR-3 bacterium]